MSILLGTVYRTTEFDALPEGVVIRAENSGSHFVSAYLAQKVDQYWLLAGNETYWDSEDLASTGLIWRIIYLPEVDEDGKA